MLTFEVTSYAIGLDSRTFDLLVCKMAPLPTAYDDQNFCPRLLIFLNSKLPSKQNPTNEIRCY